MKLKIDLEQVIQEESLEIKDLNINGKKYSLEIINSDKVLTLDFNDGEYMIRIDENGIRFSRLKYRPGHDHNDEEDLQEVTNPKKFCMWEAKKGELFWSKQFPYNPKEDGHDFFYVPFGPVKE